MMSLFSSFDYFFHFFSPSFYLIFYLSTMFSLYYFNYLSFVLFSLFDYLKNFFVSLGYSGTEVKGSFFLFIGLFYVLFLLNFTSVLSFNFPATSHVSVVMGLSFILWLGMVIFNLFSNLNGFVGHLVPSGTPIYLVFFMVVVELISVMIRPITLMVRLVANVLSGHLLMILLSNLVFSFPYFLFFYALLNVVEIFVSLIQAYIFSTLLVLYLSDAI